MNRSPFPDRAYTRVGRVNRRNPCPICGAIDQCIAYTDPTHPGITQVWCIRGGQEGGREINWGFRGSVWYYELGGTIPVRPKQLPSSPPVLPPIERDPVYRGIERLFPLNDLHKQKLQARGYDLAVVGTRKRWHFASLPEQIGLRYVLILQLIAGNYTNSEEALTGIYGFVPTKDVLGFLPMVQGSALVEFIIDEHGRYIGFQYAPDSPRHTKSGKPVKRLSPPRQESTDLFHVARGRDDDGSTCWHTEGIHKANLVADRTQSIALASIGVGNYTGAIAGAQAVDPDRSRLHLIAIDFDKQDAREEAKLVRTLRDRLGYRVARARWSTQYNGPDDALVAGQQLYTYPYVEDLGNEFDF